MIIANITTYIGQCAGAEHYYCNYIKGEDTSPPEQFCSYIGIVHEEVELKRTITKQSDATALNKKDNWKGWRIGFETNRFDSFKEIHKKLIKLFPKETIVTYYEQRLFKEMLYRKNGVNLGYKAFGEVWEYLPNGCYKHLLPPSSEIKVKCETCGKEYKFEDIIKERDWDGEIQIKFLMRRDLIDHCDCFDLVWNVIL